MQFSAAVAAIVVMATTALATPVAAPNSTVVYGTLVEENVAAPPADMELVFSEAVVEGDSGVEKRSYYGTCGYCHLQYLQGDNGALNLVCECKQKNGNWMISTLNLNYCIANANGNLVWRYHGGFQASCVHGEQWYNHPSTGFSLKCNPYPSYWTKVLTLDEKIHNYDGILGCQVPF